MRFRLTILVALGLAVACSDDEAGESDSGSTDTGTTDGGTLDAPGGNDASADAADAVEPIPGTQVAMDFTRSSGFYGAPFPDESLRGTNGIDLSDYPNPSNVQFIDDVIAMLGDSATGFGVTSGVFFQLTGAPGPLPTLHETVEDSAPVFLLGVDPASPDYLVRYPVYVGFAEDAGPFGAENLLSLIPLQGVPLREDSSYAAVVLRALGDAAGDPLGVGSSMAALSAGERPAGMNEQAHGDYVAALSALAEAGVEPGEVAGMAVFTTGNPVREVVEALAQVLRSPLPEPTVPFARNEVFDDFCVYETTIMMPVFQAGQPPFTQGGGGWTFDEGELVLQGYEEANFVATVPRLPMPPNGFPVVVFVRTGSGADRGLVDRGVRVELGGDFIEPGSGPALHFARAGFAGLSIDGPHGGLRNVTNGDEQILVFNVTNPLALRDNIRQSVLEIALEAHIVEHLEIDASDCPDVSTGDDGTQVVFDWQTMALMGHSTGAQIAIPTLAVQPRYRAAILSGAGGSYIENIVYKLSPLQVRPLAEAVLGYLSTGRTLNRHDPALSLLQWAGEPADPPAYARRVISEPPDRPRHVLMLQGIVDTYILPPIANAASLSLGLDLAGQPLDDGPAELEEFDPLEPLLDLVGRHAVALPVSANLDLGTEVATAVVVQHPEGPVEDGHEIAFETEGPKHQYRCFLASFASGGPPRVPVAGGETDPCE